jgi:tetratricopeptide (TPR) repeat protein
MTGPTVFAGLVVAASILAPKLPARTDWIGEIVFITKSSRPCGQVEADGSFTPTGTLRSIQYIVLKDEKGRVQVVNDGKRVWVDKSDLVRIGDAVQHYTKMLDEEPNNSNWFAFRGWARFRSGKPDEALKDYADAIRLSPRSGVWYNNRAMIYSEQKKYDEALADLTTAIELSASSEMAYRNRAIVHTKKKDFARAAADYAKVLDLNPESAGGYNGLAWLLCTAPDEKVRDGKRALELAQKACELTDHKNGGYLDTLAAAYAERGQFDKAVEWQEKALAAGDMPVRDADAARKRLELYKQKKPYRGDE